MILISIVIIISSLLGWQHIQLSGEGAKVYLNIGFSSLEFRAIFALHDLLGKCWLHAVIHLLGNATMFAFVAKQDGLT